MRVFQHVFVLQVGFFAWRTTSSSGEIFSINRRRADSFDVPSSLCSSISTVCKENFQAVKRRQDCACRCQATVNGSTFGYFNGGWRCVRGSDLRKQRQCKVLFAGEKTRSELFVLPAQSRKSLNTNTLPTVDRNCSLDENWSYLECNGKWKAVQNESSAFTFEAGYVQVNRQGSIDHAGKIIQLGISCERQAQPVVRRHCLLFKLFGRMQCTNVGSMLEYGTERSVTSNSSVAPPTVSPTTEVKTSTNTQETKTRASTSLSQTTTQFPPSDGNSQVQTSNFSVVVPSVVAPLTVLTVVILVVCIICRRKHRSMKQPDKNLSSNKSSLPIGVSNKSECADATLGDNENYGESNQAYETLSPKKRENGFYQPLVKGDYTPWEDNHYEEVTSYNKDIQPRSGKFIDRVYDEPVNVQVVIPLKSVEEDVPKNEAYEEPVNNQPPVYLEVI